MSSRANTCRTPLRLKTCAPTPIICPHKSANRQRVRSTPDWLGGLLNKANVRSRTATFSSGAKAPFATSSASHIQPSQPVLLIALHPLGDRFPFPPFQAAHFCHLPN